MLGEIVGELNTAAYLTEVGNEHGLLLASQVDGTFSVAAGCGQEIRRPLRDDKRSGLGRGMRD